MPDSPDDASAPEHDPPPALADLRAAVREAADRIEHLRERTARLEDENESLRERVAELEADPAAGRDGAALLVDDDPEVLRERIDRFIDALDGHLDRA